MSFKVHFDCAGSHSLGASDHGRIIVKYVHFDCAGSHSLGAAVRASNDCALVVVPCAFSHMMVTFRGRHRGNLVFWCFKVDFS